MRLAKLALAGLAALAVSAVAVPVLAQEHGAPAGRGTAVSVRPPRATTPELLPERLPMARSPLAWEMSKVPLASTAPVE